jgi:hypothetical protein
VGHGVHEVVGVVEVAVVARSAPLPQARHGHDALQIILVRRLFPPVLGGCDCGYSPWFVL